MTIEQGLRPYYKRIYLAYAIQVALLTLSAVLLGLITLMLVSRIKVMLGIHKIMILYSILCALLGLLLGLIRRPLQETMTQKIDRLGFENRVATLLEYQGGSNPFYAYLERDLLIMLGQEARYRNIPLMPTMRYRIMPLILMAILAIMPLWQTEPWLKGQSIERAIEGIEAEEESLMETLEAMELSEEKQLLQEEIASYLDSIKEAMAEDNPALIEENLYKMEEILSQELQSAEFDASDFDEIPGDVSESLEAISELSLGNRPATLLSSLAQASGESNLAEGLTNQSEEAMSSDVDSYANAAAKADGTMNLSDAASETSDGKQSGQSGSNAQNSGDGQSGSNVQNSGDGQSGSNVQNSAGGQSGNGTHNIPGAQVGAGRGLGEGTPPSDELYLDPRLLERSGAFQMSQFGDTDTVRIEMLTLEGEYGEKKDYQDVLDLYEKQALREMAEQSIPVGMETVVKDYFTKINQ